MAESTTNVNKFLSDLLDKVKPLHQTDMEQLANLALSDGITQLEIYDITYYSRVFVDREGLKVGADDRHALRHIGHYFGGPRQVVVAVQRVKHVLGGGTRVVV